MNRVYYEGTTEEQWNEITIGYSNYELENADHYYYSAEEPASGSTLKYWHYDDDGNPVAWN